MSQLSDEQKDRIIKELAERGATLPCPRCGSHRFEVLDGYFNQLMSGDIGTVVLGGPTVPSVATGCSNCGYLSLHALGVLGLLPSDKEERKNDE